MRNRKTLRCVGGVFKKIIFTIFKTPAESDKKCFISGAPGEYVYKDEGVQDRYYGRRFSILGDSISTLEGYVPSEYRVFFGGENCRRSGIYAPGDTWWGKVIDFFGGKILVNNSWSGSRVAKLPESEQVFPSGCSEERISGLHIKSGQDDNPDILPEIIIIYIGTNDWAFGTPLHAGRNNPNDITCFDAAYDRMLSGISDCYPNAEIWCCGLSPTYMSGNCRFEFPYCYGGTHLDEYNQVIRQKTEKYYLNYIPLVTPYDTIDGTHPNDSGMNTIAEAVICAMCNGEGGKRNNEYKNKICLWTKR